MLQRPGHLASGSIEVTVSADALGRVARVIPPELQRLRARVFEALGERERAGVTKASATRASRACWRSTSSLLRPRSSAPSSNPSNPRRKGNEVTDAELIDCVRQSAFTIELPMPIESGRIARQLTMPFGARQNEPERSR